MELSVRDVAKLLNKSDKTIYRWVNQGRLPATKLNDQIRFHRAELMEWALAKKINVSAKIFEHELEDETALSGLETALREGGIFYRVGGSDISSVLTAVVDVIPVPSEVDRTFLREVLLAREALGSTGIGNGISIPHPRNPIIMYNDQPMVSLCFLEKPVDFKALDQQPVKALFTVISPTIRGHLHLLSLIAFALQQCSFMKLIQQQANRENILKAASIIDQQLTEKAASGTGK